MPTFVVVVLAVVVVPFFIWKLRSKKRGKPYADDWEEKARSRTPPVG